MNYRLRVSNIDGMAAHLVFEHGGIGFLVVAYEPAGQDEIERLAGSWNACIDLEEEALKQITAVRPRSPALDICADVLTERSEQINDGHHAAHDDREHPNGELAQAAADLCLYDSGLSIRDAEFTEWKSWGLTAKFAGNRRQQLVVAAALIFAEIERLDRAAKGGAP